MNKILEDINFPHNLDVNKKEDLFNFFFNINPNGFRRFGKHEFKFSQIFPIIYSDFLTWKFPDDWSFSQKMYHYLHNDKELKIGKCKECGKQIKWKSFSIGYLHIFCSNRCGTINKETQLKKENTCIELYGCKSYSQTNEYKNKVKTTSQNNWGVDNYTQTNEYKYKSKETCQNNWGVDYVTQSEEIKNKIKETWSKKSNSELEGIKNKTKKTNIINWGVDNYSKTNKFKDQYKSTCQEKWGVDNVFQTEEIKQKSREKCYNKWGVYSYSQTNEFAQKRVKKIPFNNLTFDSSWEVIVYKFCQEHNIPCEYQPNIQFEYEYEGKKHIYQPDFLINGKLYEVKGEHFFEGDKMINPYNRLLDEKYESKYQCMIQNNVIIIRKKDIDEIKSNNYIFEKG